MPAERVAGVILAAGAATRFGTDKLATELAGRTLLDRSASAMLDAGLDPVVAVVQPPGDRPLPDRVAAVVNDRWGAGMATSVRAGLAALRSEPDIGAAVVAPADQPWCGPEVYLRLLEAYRHSRRGLIVATFDHAMRNPVLLSRSNWGLADRITGDVGLSAVVRSLSPQTVECADIGSVDDVDTHEDLARRCVLPDSKESLR